MEMIMNKEESKHFIETVLKDPHEMEDSVHELAEFYKNKEKKGK